MIKKISATELNIEIQKSNIGKDYDEIENTPHITVCHNHDWDHGFDNYESVEVSVKGDIIEKAQNIRTIEEFFFDLNDMYEFLMNYFRTNNISEIIIAPFHNYHQFYVFDEEIDICKNIYSFLIKNKLKINDRGGISINIENNSEKVKMIIEGGFRGYTMLCFFSPKNNVLIEPTHHFELIFYSCNIDTTLFDTIIKQHPNLYRYEQ